MEPEAIVLDADKIFRWDGPKRKQTLIKAKLGRLILTNHRLLFLSTGKNDITLSRLAAGAASPMGALYTGSTGDLDLSATEAPGGVNVARSQVRDAVLKGMFKVMTVTWVDESGAEQVATFAPKNGGMPGGPDWVRELTGRLP